MKKEGQIARSLKSKLTWPSQIFRKKVKQDETVDSGRSQKLRLWSAKRAINWDKDGRESFPKVATSQIDKGDLEGSQLVHSYK